MNVARRMRSQWGLFLYLKVLGILVGRHTAHLSTFRPRRTKHGVKITVPVGRVGEALGIPKELQPRDHTHFEKNILLPAQRDIAAAGFALDWQWMKCGRKFYAIDIMFAALTPGRAQRAADLVA